MCGNRKITAFTMKFWTTSVPRVLVSYSKALKPEAGWASARKRVGTLLAMWLCPYKTHDGCYEKHRFVSGSFLSSCRRSRGCKAYVVVSKCERLKFTNF